MTNKYPGKCARCGMTVPAGTGTLSRENGQWVVRHSGECPEITSGLGIGGVGSDDYSMATEGDPMLPEYDREAHRPGQQVCPAGTTYGTRGGPNDRCHCGRPGDWNSGAGQYLCSRHWDEY